MLQTLKNCILLVAVWVFPQLQLLAQLTLEEAMTQAIENAPVQRLKGITAAENDLQIKKIGMSFRPQVSVLAQATYQSEVTNIDIPLPGIEIEPLSKDQYKLQAELSQTLYDGGLTARRKALQTTAGAIEQQQVELDLEQLRTQVINSYFAVLEVDTRLELLAYKREDLLAREKVVLAAVENGTLLKMEHQTLQAALLQLDQQERELTAVRRARLRVLSLLTKREWATDTRLELPASVVEESNLHPNKAMYRLFALQQTSVDQKQELNSAMLRPKAGFFVQGGYGRPGLNFLKNEFSSYLIAGARIQWSLSGWYTKSNDAQLQTLGKEKIKTHQEAYDLQLSTQVTQHLAEIEKLKDLISRDEALIDLRQQIVQTAAVQLDNGVMTSADYLLRLNQENEARIQKALHEVQLLKNQYLLQQITGNY